MVITDIKVKITVIMTPHRNGKLGQHIFLLAFNFESENTNKYVSIDSKNIFSRKDLNDCVYIKLVYNNHNNVLCDFSTNLLCATKLK